MSLSAVLHPARLAPALGALALAACGNGEPLCNNEIIREAVSPDGALKATLFQRDCGQPTGSSSQVSITAAAEPATEKGNVFIADTDSGLARAEAWGGPDVQLAWTAPRALTLTFAALSRVLVHEESVRGVTITFQSRIEQ